ncbi:hypothetical protein MBLNU457_7293t1 [Dothideomycetes sp. NU457]
MAGNSPPVQAEPRQPLQQLPYDPVEDALRQRVETLRADMKRKDTTIQARETRIKKLEEDNRKLIAEKRDAITKHLDLFTQIEDDNAELRQRRVEVEKRRDILFDQKKLMEDQQRFVDEATKYKKLYDQLYEHTHERGGLIEVKQELQKREQEIRDLQKSANESAKKTQEPQKDVSFYIKAYKDLKTISDGFVKAVGDHEAKTGEAKSESEQDKTRSERKLDTADN